MTSIFKKQSRQTLTEIALSNIRKAIEDGLLRPGERIIEARLAEEMEISRFPIREALRILEQEGLVITEPFKGVRVVSISSNDLKEIMTVRCALEELAIHLAVKNITPEKIARLEAIVKVMKKAVKDNDTERIFNADLEFHKMLCRLSENSRLLKAWTPLASQIRICLKMEYPFFTTGDDFVETHQPIIEAIRKGRSKEAAQILNNHIYGALKRISADYGELSPANGK